MKHLQIPTQQKIECCIDAAAAELESYIIRDEEDGVIYKVACCVCGLIPDEAYWHEMVDVKALKKLCQYAKMEKVQLDGIYCTTLINQYTANHTELQDLVLSPEAHVNKLNEICICKNCHSELIHINQQKSEAARPPRASLCNGYLTGKASECLTKLNEVELSLLSPVRLQCQVWVFYAGCHQQIRGYTSFLMNRNEQNMANLEFVNQSIGTKTLMVVLCGAFTTTQAAAVMAKTQVRIELVREAWNWLKENNYRFETLELPDPLPCPQIQYEDYNEKDEGSLSNIENIMTITHIFPDATMPGNLDGGFRSQEDFRQFLLEQGGDNVNLELHSRPTVERVVDYSGDEIGGCFLLQFPFGHTGLPADKAVVALSKLPNNVKHMKRDYHQTLKMYLRKSENVFHGAKLNLVISNLIIKKELYISCRLQANTRDSSGKQWSLKFSNMSSDKFMAAIDTARSGKHSAHLTEEDLFLRSISATCQHLPNSIEAAEENRRIYFSNVARFGSPGIFFTISPDDSRNPRLVAYAIGKDNFKTENMPDLQGVTEEDIIFSSKLRSDARFDNPGLCATEYERIINAVINNLFQWDTEKSKSKGMGIFGEVEAWCLATEEQGRKSLHGHFLLFIKDWPEVLEALQKARDTPKENTKAIITLKCNVLKFFDTICTTQAFENHCEGMPLGRRRKREKNKSKKRERPVMPLDCTCRRSKAKKDEDGNPIYTGRPANRIEPPTNQCIREMRHHSEHKKYEGYIGRCKKCKTTFHIDQVVANVMQDILECQQMEWPENKIKYLDYYVHEQGKLSWKELCKNVTVIAIRLFTAMILTSLHFAKHSNRCFKNKNMCFANLPDAPLDASEFNFAETANTWHNWYGKKQGHTMFTLQPKRGIPDIFINKNNKAVTQLLGYNNNVTFGLSGLLIFYITNYQSKKPQKDEQEVFATIAVVFSAILKKAEAAEITLAEDARTGLRRLLAGVYSHTSHHIVAAPMANYLTKHTSRFRFSHPVEHLPVSGMESILHDRYTIMRYQMHKQNTIISHKAMDYLFRPKACEVECMYSFYSKFEPTPKTKDDTEEDELFYYLSEHPKSSFMKTVQRFGPDATPVLSWRYLGNTRDFHTDLFSAPNRNDCDYEMKELYCFKFMMLFLPFRSLQELMVNDSFQLRFQLALKNTPGEWQQESLEPTSQISDGFDVEMLKIAHNLQCLANSQESDIPQNKVTQTTKPIEDEEEKPKERDTADAAQMEALIARITKDLILSDNTVPLTTEPVSLNPILTEDTFENEFFGTPNTNPEDYNNEDNNPLIMEHGTENTTTQNGTTASNPQMGRHKVQMTALNSLMSSSFQVFRDTMDRPDSDSYNETQEEHVTIIANGTAESIKATVKHEGLDERQSIAAEIIIAEYVLSFAEEAKGELSTTEEQSAFDIEVNKLLQLARRHRRNQMPLRMLLTGPAGAGKSAVIETVITYAKAYSKLIGHVYVDRQTIRLTAMTGSAAADIGGITAHSEFFISGRGQTTRTIKEVHIAEFADTRLIFIDEYSFAGESFTVQLNEKLQRLTEDNHSIFGSKPIIFLADFRQLTPIGTVSLYTSRPKLVWNQAINCMVELKGQWRFKDDPEYGDMMSRMRDRGLSQADIKRINTRLVGSTQFDPITQQHHMVTIPDVMTTQFATAQNQKRSDLNGNVIKSYLQANHANATCIPASIPRMALVVKAGIKYAKNSTVVSYGVQKVIFENCNESHCEKDNKRCDPLLCVFKGCALMCTANDDVKNGIANGTTTRLKHVKLKPNVIMVPIQIHGFWVWSVNAEDVECFVLEWKDNNRFRGTFTVPVAPYKKYNVDYPFQEHRKIVRQKIKLCLQQVPVILNHATTCHKLQGKSLEELVITEWGSMQNWAYVVLSRVRSLKRLYLTKPLPTTIVTTPNEDYMQMMADFQCKAINPEDVEMENNQRILLTEGIWIIQDDLDRLPAGKWLSDSLIRIFSKKLMDTSTTPSWCCDLSNYTVFLSHNTVVLSEEICQEAAISSVWFLPINITNTHWQLVAILRNHGDDHLYKALIFDSGCATGRPGNYRTLRKYVSHIIQNVHPLIDAIPHPSIIFPEVIPVVQLEGECGVHLLKNMEYTLENVDDIRRILHENDLGTPLDTRNWYEQGVDVDRFRDFMRNTLLNP